MASGRDGKALATWLKEHPGVEVISRDRWAAFAQAAAEGIPQARQGADRWHLLKNLREGIGRQLGRLKILVGAFDAGRVAETQQWHRKLFPLCRVILGVVTNPIPIKAAMMLLGSGTGELHQPMCPLDPAGEPRCARRSRSTGCWNRLQFYRSRHRPRGPVISGPTVRPLQTAKTEATPAAAKRESPLHNSLFHPYPQKAEEQTGRRHCLARAPLLELTLRSDRRPARAAPPPQASPQP